MNKVQDMQRQALKKTDVRAACISILKVMGIILFMALSLAQADLRAINIRLSGTVVALGCTVEPGDVDKPVNLGEWATKQLKKNGSSTNPVAFSISLTGCTASGVTLAFTGTKDKTDNSLLALNNGGSNAAQGVAVQIMDSQRNRISVGDNAPRGVVDANGNLTLNFYANYVATADSGVTAGVADADSIFTLTYD